MEQNKLSLTTYNCKHCRFTGDKYNFINDLVCNTDFVLLQEICLYPTEFPKLLQFGSNSDMIATCAMDETIHKVGRPFGGVSIIWKSLIKGQVIKIDCESSRLCGLLFTQDNVTMLIMNVYMPCDKNNNDPEYIDVLNMMSQLCYKYNYNPNHVVIGGDFNVDFSRNSANTRSLQDFITDFSLFTSIDLPDADVPYTFINYDSCTSRIDHFLLSESMKSNVLLSAIIDNHLYSDHIPLQLTLSLDISHDKQIELPFEVRQSWCKATNHDIRKYKDNLDEQLDNIVLCDSVVYCKDHTCTKHRENLCKIYSSVIDSCVTSSQHIPNNSSYKSSKVMPGWNDQVQQLKEEALSWHAYWKAHGRPTSGYVAEMHRIIRARYHRAMRHIEKEATKIQSEKMAQSILSDGSRGVWPEVRKIKGKKGKMACSMDGCNDNDDIANIFSEKYMELYNSVPYDTSEMKSIESSVLSRILNSSCSDYIITVTDVMNAIAHLKSGKSDGSEGLFSDHFIHGTHRFYVILSILFTAMLSHGFSSNSMILGTMIPIPKDKKKSLCNSGNYRAIALSSIFSKILDWVILIKEEMTLCSSNLQFGFKKGTSSGGLVLKSHSVICQKGLCYFS